jgi:hypothetical protein
MQVLENGKVVSVPAALSVFRVRPDGNLDYVRKCDLATGDELLFWAGMVAI